ncbi:helix-turn-helix domain-containing protein [Streptomyces coeruleorubidus]|uniref:helix-turn-helix domain-containing protein n=1 Tax=Streptomyces coeruleorubidus TaxID=116188 RepID=UPI003693E24A
MDQRREIREFLSTRRAKITPEQAGLPAMGGHRRVPGLRREEVALLAGISVEYYARLERGKLRGASDTVLDAVARALRLDEAEHAHLRDLARTAHTGAARRVPRRSRPQPVRPTLQHLLDAMTEAPAFIRNGRLDVLAINRLGRALYAPALTGSAHPANLARFRFLDPAAADFYADLDNTAHSTVALLRTEFGRDPHNHDLTDLIGELSNRSEEFRTLWATHDVRLHRTGAKTFHHPAVGPLRLAYEAMPLPTDPGLTLTAYTAEPGTASHESLKILASWGAALDHPDLPEPGAAPTTETRTA